MSRLPAHLRDRHITVGDATEILENVLNDANRVLVRKPEYYELMAALEAFGMREFPTDSVKLRRIKTAYHALRGLSVE